MAKSIVLVRHESAELDLRDFDEIKGYMDGSYNPPLRQKGIDGAKELAKKLPKINFWFSSPLIRSRMTAYPFGGYLDIVERLTIADYGDIPDEVIKEYIKGGFDDAFLYKRWAQTEGFERTVARVDELWDWLLEELEYINENNIGIVTHDEICGLLLCKAKGIDPALFACDDVKVKRGEAVIINLDDNGLVTGVERL